MKKTLTALLLFIAIYSWSQNKVDSLVLLWENNEIKDSIRVNALIKISQVLEKNGEKDSVLFWLNRGIEAIDKTSSKNQLARLYVEKGNFYKKEQDVENALKYYKESLNLYIEIKDTIAIIDQYDKIGFIYFYRANYSDAMTYLLDRLRIAEEYGDKKILGNSFNNVGAIYKETRNHSKAIDYYTKSLSIYQEIGDSSGIATAYSNIATIYSEENDFPKAMEFNKKSLAYRLLQTNENRLAISYFNIALCYVALDSISEFPLTDEEVTSNSKINLKGVKSYNKERALFYYDKALQLSKSIQFELLEAACYLGLGELCYKNKDFKESIKYANIGLEKCRKLGNLIYVSEASLLLYENYRELKQYKKALKLYEFHIEMRDSLTEEENHKELIKQEFKYEYEKQATTDSIKHLEEQRIKEVLITKQETEIKNKKTQQYALFGGLGLVALFALFTLKKNKQVKEQSKEIEQQKEFAEEQQQFAEQQKEELSFQHNQIKDSIDYAQTLQKAVLPSVEDVSNNFKNNFIYFQPKDVVSGDFFWTFSKNNINYLAVVDCTGHGVPGAFMTIVANNLLNEIVLEDFSTPKEIIEELHKRIKVRVGGHKNAKVRDSMDLGLLSYDASSKKVNFVGTHTSLYLVRNSKLQKIKGSKADIGYSETINVKEHIVEVMENDMLYFHSDGYPDQKGGPKNKKFYYQPIRTKFEEISLLNLGEQNSIMEKTFNDWIGEREQLDDVCMIGIRI